LVTVLHEAGPAYRALLATVGAEPAGIQVATADGSEHTLWRVDDEALAEVTAELADARLYIADGHHRVAATRLFWDSDAGSGAAGLPVVVHAFDGLRLEPFHRVVPGPAPRERLDLLEDRFRASYDVSSVDAVPEVRTGRVAMYSDGQWLLGRSRERPETGVQGLDAVLLERRVLAPSGAQPTLTVRAPLTELACRCDADGGVLFALAPPPLSALTEIADRGEVMPAKTTSFQPKPVSGLLLSE
jgi:uncharacterized protein (DUF1015 family)